jgi:hypothetical protein
MSRSGAPIGILVVVTALAALKTRAHGDAGQRHRDGQRAAM